LLPSWCGGTLQNYVAKPLIVCNSLIQLQYTSWLNADQFNNDTMMTAPNATATILSTKLSTAFVDKPESHEMTDT
jgi:hypothetical protein